jgi:hypothetical protein
VTLKHIYEIAKLKSQDPSFENVELIRICRLVIGSAHSLGIEVVKGDLLFMESVKQMYFLTFNSKQRRARMAQ